MGSMQIGLWLSDFFKDLLSLILNDSNFNILYIISATNMLLIYDMAY